jgi:hypothetical protein
MTWHDKMNAIHEEFDTAAYRARVLAVHAQSQAQQWHDDEPTAESQVESAEWHREARRLFDEWDVADDRLRAMQAAAKSRRDLMDEVEALHDLFRQLREAAEVTE